MALTTTARLFRFRFYSGNLASSVFSRERMAGYLALTKPGSCVATGTAVFRCARVVEEIPVGANRPTDEELDIETLHLEA